MSLLGRLLGRRPPPDPTEAGRGGALRDPDGKGPFSPDFLRRLSHLRVRARRSHAGRFAALTRSRKLGSGIDFADHRPYYPGDDFKDIDWRLYGRLGQLMVRLAEEETELNIYLLVDVSQSMQTGGPISKLEFARRAAAAIAYVGLAHLDRVHIYPFGRELARPLTPPRNKAQVFQVYRHLLKADEEVGGVSDLGAAAKAFLGVARTRGIALVFSDFLMPSWQTGLDLLRFGRFEVGLVQMLAPEELDPPALAHRREVVLIDSETGRRRRVRLTKSIAERYHRKVLEHGEELASYARRYNLFYAHARSDQPFEELVLRTFRAERLLT